MPSFNDFSLQPATRAVLSDMEITQPTPIQAGAIPALLAGNDLVGQSATGSGKTLAYGIPLVERLSKNQRVVQALVLVPTRELAVQVNTVLSRLATGRRITTALLVGGRPYGNQISALRYGSQIVVGTPGRVKDHLERGTLVLSNLKLCILDEADQMLDIGFAPVIEEILATTPETRQMALFSATMPDWVAKLQKKFLKDPITIDITPASDEESTIEQIAYQVPQEKKMAALCTLLLSTEGESSLIFGKTKFGIEKLGKQLSKLGFMVGTLHGNKSQRAREDVLTAFRRGQVHTLLATNVAARGLDIKGIYQVINYELPESSELFTHRIGRTGRMGQQGKAITLLAPSDLPKWRRMARNLGQAVSLQRLTIDENATVPRPLAAGSEISIVPDQDNEQQPVRNLRQFSREYERDSERPVRGRRQFSSGFERDSEQPERGRRQFSSERSSERPARNRRQFSQEYERDSEQQPEHNRRQFSPAVEQDNEQPVRTIRQFSSDQDTERPVRSRRQFSSEYEQNNERPARSRRQFSQEPERERGRRTQPKHDHSSDLKRRQKDSVPGRNTERTSAWQPEALPERQYSGKRSVAGKAPARTSGKPSTRSFAAIEPQYQPGKARTNSAARPKRATGSKRFASR